MERRPFSEVLKNTGVDLQKEYERLYILFYGRSGLDSSVEEQIDSRFYLYPHKGTCLSFTDFNETHHFFFDQYPCDFDLNYLVNFCEYCYNLCSYFCFARIIDQISKILDLIHYEIVQVGPGIHLFVEKNAVVTSVSEIVPAPVSIKLLEYNHHRMQGNLEKKQQVLKAMADYIEPQAGAIAGIDNALKNNLFYLFNNFNIRHNNSEPGSKHNSLLDDMEDAELEKIYDDTYQLWLLAILQLDNVERKQRIEEYKAKQGR